MIQFPEKNLLVKHFVKRYDAIFPDALDRFFDAKLDPRTLTRIGDYAFVSCHTLKEITLPKGLCALGFQSFHNCSSLTCIRMPKHLQKAAAKAVDRLCVLETYG